MKSIAQFVILLALHASSGFAFEADISPFLEDHCYDCHADGMDKGGLDFDKLGRKLSDPAAFAKWEMVFDRVRKGEMPPEKVKTRPSGKEKAHLEKVLGSSLNEAHQIVKGTVLRRLNRREYQNTLNDLFGTSIDLEGISPAISDRFRAKCAASRPICSGVDTDVAEETGFVRSGCPSTSFTITIATCIR